MANPPTLLELQTKSDMMAATCSMIPRWRFVKPGWRRLGGEMEKGVKVWGVGVKEWGIGEEKKRIEKKEDEGVIRKKITQGRTLSGNRGLEEREWGGGLGTRRSQALSHSQEREMLRALLHNYYLSNILSPLGLQYWGGKSKGREKEEKSKREVTKGKKKKKEKRKKELDSNWQGSGQWTGKMGRAGNLLGWNLMKVITIREKGSLV